MAIYTPFAQNTQNPLPIYVTEVLLPYNSFVFYRVLLLVRPPPPPPPPAAPLPLRAVVCHWQW
jgi:hypothetical protein